MPAVPLRDRDHEPQVRVDHALLGAEVAALDTLRERDLVGGGEELVATDLGEEHAEGIGGRGAGAGREVELEVVLFLRCGQVDAALREERLEGRHGLLVEVVLEHERVELGGLDLAALLRLGGERVQCRNLDDACLQRIVLVSLRKRGAVVPAQW